MESLPQEILDQICSMHFSDRARANLPPDNLPFKRSSLATISRRWQWAVERQSFKCIACKSTELNAFNRIIFSHRRHFLKVLQYTIILPYYTPKSCTLFEREADRTANNAAFTTAIYGLFQILHSWGSESETGSPYTIHISIKDIYSPMDYGYHASTTDSPGTANFKTVKALTDADREAGNLRDLQQHRFEYSSLRLLHPTDLPVVPAVRSFRIDTRLTGDGARIISPASLLEIATRLPNSSICWIYSVDRLLNYPTPRLTERDTFQRALKRIGFPTSIQHLFISVYPIGFGDQSRHPISLMPPGVSHDPLSSTLREKTADLPHLNRLSIKGVLDHSVLWSDALSTQPFWQHLQDLQIDFDLTTPMGEWYFQRADDAGHHPHPAPSSISSRMPPGYGFSIDEDVALSLRFATLASQRESGMLPINVFRNKVNERLINPFIQAFAKACIQIPTLKKASLKTVLFESVETEYSPLRVPWPWGIYYSAPGQSHNFQSPRTFEPENARHRALVYDVRDWRLGEDLSCLLRKIGQSLYSEEATEMYIDQWATLGRSVAEKRARKLEERRAREQQAREQQMQQE